MITSRVTVGPPDGRSSPRRLRNPKLQRESETSHHVGASRSDAAGGVSGRASRLAVAPALGLLSTADAFGYTRPDPAVQVVAGVWTMTGVNVEG